jgi:hypothetical protein
MSYSALVGGAAWMIFAAASRFHWVRINTIELLFLLGPLLVVPLGLELCVRLGQTQGPHVPFRIAQIIYLPAALCAAVSFGLPPGRAASFVATPWFVFGCFIGLTGITTFIREQFRTWKTWCLVASFLYLPVGCAWLMASRLGLSPMGFQEPIVLLTAVHFHFAGFAAPLMALAAGSQVEEARARLRRVFIPVAMGVAASPALLAAGFVIGPRFKLAMAIVVVCSESGLSLFFLTRIGAMRPRLAQLCVAISAFSVLFAMFLAGVWAIGEFPLQPFVHLDEMARFHGAANALGFVLCGLMGWALATPHRLP